MGIEFVKVNIDTTGLYAAKVRDYGTVGIVGVGGSGNSEPVLIGSYAEAKAAYGSTDLGKAVQLALLNGASCVWAVDIVSVSLANVEAGLGKLEGKDIQIVCLANIVETADNAYISGKLATHVLTDGTERIGVFMLAKGEDATTMPTAITGMLSANSNRMFGVAHNSDNDVAAAIAGLIAGIKPWDSPLLKAIEGVVQTGGFTTTQIAALEESQINVLVNPTYLAGSSFVLGSDYTLGSPADGIHFLDVRRTIDDISYKLKSTLTNPGVIGALRINKGGLGALSGKIAGVLQVSQGTGEIESYGVNIPALTALAKEVGSRSEADLAMINTARTSRVVDTNVTIEYAGSFHTIKVDLKITT